MCVCVCLPACAHPCMFAGLIMLLIIFVKTKNNHFLTIFHVDWDVQKKCAWIHASAHIDTSGYFCTMEGILV